MSAHYINKNEAKHLLILLFCKINVALGEEAGIYSGSYIINRITCKILNYCTVELISQFSTEPVVLVAERPPPANFSFWSQKSFFFTIWSERWN